MLGVFNWFLMLLGRGLIVIGNIVMSWTIVGWIESGLKIRMDMFSVQNELWRIH